MHSAPRTLLTLALCLTFAVSACSRGETPQPSVATPSVSFARTRAALGSPIEVTYKFQVASDARFTQDYLVLVHFLDSDGELMWTDDHQPAKPTTQWKPGETVEYTRTMFVPIYPYIGDTAVHVGLYSARDGSRLTLAGQDSGQREYKVASLQLLPHSDNVFLLFKDGWHAEESAGDNAAIGWHWTQKTATLSFRNPKKESVFYLHADNPGTYAEPQTVTLALNGAVVDTVQVTPGKEFVHRTTLTAEQLGDGDMVDLTLELDKTWVPALVPSANSRDSRELGLRVFHAFVEPRG